MSHDFGGRCPSPHACVTDAPAVVQCPACTAVCGGSDWTPPRAEWVPRSPRASAPHLRLLCRCIPGAYGLTGSPGVDGRAGRYLALLRPGESVGREPQAPEGYPDLLMDSQTPHRCDPEYWGPMAGSPGPLSYVWLTLQGSGLASSERDCYIPTILPPFNSLLFNAKASDLGKALLEIQSSHREPDGGG